MNNKGITDVILVLILSGIAVALIFLGIVYTYTSLACYVGVNPQQSLGFYPGQLARVGVDLDVSSEDPTNQSVCNQSCTTLDCNKTCSRKYPNVDKEYVAYTYTVGYRGTRNSAVGLSVIENQAAMSAFVFASTSPGTLNSGGSFKFYKTYVANMSCEADMNTTAFTSPAKDSFVSKTRHNNYCVSPEPADVDVIVNSVWYPDVNIAETSVSIVGGAVKDLCPAAEVWYNVRRNGFFNVYANLINNSNGTCGFIIDTNATKADNNGWYNPNWIYRTQLDVFNDNGKIEENEVVYAVLNFSKEKLGFDANMTSCEKEIVVTARDGTTKLTRYVSNTKYFNGTCIGADIMFEYGEPTWDNATWKTFFVYITNPNPTIIQSNNYADIVPFLPKIVFKDFAATGSATENTTAAQNSVKLKESLCPTP